jgi:uncharacterized cupredoxin-like copper-binding protein
MTRNDFGATILALLMGFILSAGLVGFVLSAGGYQVPTILPAPPAPPVRMAGPMAGAAVAQPPAQAQAQGAPISPEVKVVATDLKFTPPTIQAKAGQPLKIVFENKGVIEHDIAFPTLKTDKPGAGPHTSARPGQSTTLELTPTAAGTYEYVCTIPGHKEAGMKGTINVAP